MASATTTVSVAGVGFGDFIVVSAPYSLQGIAAQGYVSAAGQVTVRLHNSTGAGVNLGSGTWRVAAWRTQALGQQTKTGVLDAVRAKLISTEADTP